MGTSARPTAVPRTAIRRIPGPRGRQLVDAVFELRRRPHELLLELALRYGPLVSLTYPVEHVVLVSDPAAIQYLLHDNPQNYLKQTGRWRALRELFGNGLLTVDGDEWRRQRQRIQPAFHRERLVAFDHHLAASLSDMFARWRTAAADGKPVDLHREMLRLSLLTITKAMFGRDVEEIVDAALRAFAATYLFINPVSLVNLVVRSRSLRRRLAPGFRDYEQAFGVLDRMVRDIIAERRAHPVDTGDMLSMLVLGRDEGHGATMSATQVRDEVMTAFQAGHEPTAIGLTWTCYLLSRYPLTRRELRAEARQVLAGRLASLDDLPRLTFHRMVVDEAMRLYPPVWGIERVAARSDHLLEYPIPAGTTVAFSPYVMHHHPAYWRNPEGFDPRRFTEERAAGRPAYAYFPFGGGPRRCVGFRFALAQMLVVLSALVQNFDLDLVPGSEVMPRPMMNFPPDRPVLMTVRPLPRERVQ